MELWLKWKKIRQKILFQEIGLFLFFLYIFHVLTQMDGTWYTQIYSYIPFQ